MSESLQGLLSLLELEPIEYNLFRGRSRDIVGRRVFGGQVLGQALMAAANTVDSTRAVHSIHGYFMRPGDMQYPIVYEVDRIRDGGSFTTRRVVAIQNGQAIFSMSASFQIHEPGFDHQSPMPEVTAPEELQSASELAASLADRIPEALRERLLRTRPIEIRPVDPVSPLEPEPAPARQSFWIRATGEMPDDPILHRAVLAFTSDFNLLGASLRPHGHTVFQREIQAASLDHAMWFHRDFRVDEWLLYAMDSPSATNARGFSRGSVFSRDGRLLASVAQEGLIRLRKPR